MASGPSMPRPVQAGGPILPLRMTVSRLLDGGLLLWSHTRFTSGLRDALAAIGPIRHLVAPTVAHWMFLRGWQVACPEPLTWAAPGLRDRAQVRAGVFAEMALFHMSSHTLVVTDLVLNVAGERLPPRRRAPWREPSASRRPGAKQGCVGEPTEPCLARVGLGLLLGGGVATLGLGRRRPGR